jgi:hypothetical protein
MTAVQPMPLLLDPMPHASADAPIGVLIRVLVDYRLHKKLHNIYRMNAFFIMQIQRMFPMVRVQIKRFASLLLKQLSGCIDKVAKLQLSLVTLLQLLVWIICEIIMVSVFQS